MAKPDTYMPLVIGDYLKDTMHLTAEQHGAYLLLLMHYWQRGPLPNDDAILAAIARMEPARWLANRQLIASFFLANDQQWNHKRVDEELERATKLQQRAIAGGTARANSATRGANGQLKTSKRPAKPQLKTSPPTPTPYNNRNGDFEGSGGDGYGTVPIDWQSRLDRHQPGKYWPETYGPKPEREGPWDAPKPLVLAWRAKHGLDASKAA